MVKQAIKKGAGIKDRKSKLAAFKEKSGLTAMNNANKPQEWIIMPDCFKEATRLPGIPCGTVVSVVGHTNVGKSTLINHAIVGAQRQGILPVIIDTENSFSFSYAQNMGFEATPVYGEVEVEDVDEETGEITTHKENQIVNWDGDFLYYNNKILCECFGDRDYSTGGKSKTKRKTAVIEDVTSAINTVLDAQEEGDIEQGVLFVFDSVGSIGSYKEYKSDKTANPMWAAAAISQSFNDIVNSRIPGSKKVTSPYTNTLLYINKVWLEAPKLPSGMPSMKTKGGTSLKYSTRLEILMGGQVSSGIKRLVCTYKSINYGYAIETKIKILKNHLDAPYNALSENTLIACDLGFISPNDVEEYKKSHITQILKELNSRNTDGNTITEQDVSFETDESEE